MTSPPKARLADSLYGFLMFTGGGEGCIGSEWVTQITRYKVFTAAGQFKSYSHPFNG